VILEGGVIGYDTNTVTGGSGAGFLGISAHSEYRQDTVTVYLRAVSVRTGEVLTSVTTSKTIASYALGGGAFRYVGFKQLLEAEAGMSTNEPDQLALQQAIEKAVYALIMEGVDLKLWDFSDPAAGWPSLWRYQQERDGVFTAEQVQAASRLVPPQAVRRPETASTSRDALAAMASNNVPSSSASSPTPPRISSRTGS
jgi:curli production assembly/transport component CsgG